MGAFGVFFDVYNEPKRDASSKVWHTVKPTLPHHLQNFANNFELLCKSQEDAKIDNVLRASELTPTDTLDDVEPIVLDPDPDEDGDFNVLSDTPSTEELLATFHLAQGRNRDRSTHSLVKTPFYSYSWFRIATPITS